MIAELFALNATPVPGPPEIELPGLAYLVPKPEPLQGYAVTNGALLCATATEESSGLNATPYPWLGGSVTGFAYLVPKPEPLQG
jgi:hypothetical protein